MNKLEQIQRLCKHHRKYDLGLTLEELCSNTDVSIKTVSAFENGNSSNINHLFLYLDKSSAKHRYVFVTQIADILRG